ncbi:PKD domain-containing protein [Thiocystis violacea]|uniref:PKD domain-containing protein n=1 Tax=Thiocystis violacea TaxID=13725 RepID=UPI00190779AC|nr:PKD domain-containing protein [Thiocystis violacea]
MSTRIDSRNTFRLAEPRKTGIPMALTFLFLGLMFIGIQAASASTASLEWDLVNDQRVAFYEVHYGMESGNYSSNYRTTATSASIEGLNPGATYYFAARACDQASTQCSDYSNELAITIPADAASTPDPATAPVAVFSASVTSGQAPLTLVFADRSTGSVTGWAWDFGDGNTSTAGDAVHTYANPGTYSVNLMVTGSDARTATAVPVQIHVLAGSTTGANPETGADDSTEVSASGFPIEVGDLTIDHEWQWVPYQRSFEDPIVIVKALGNNDKNPAIIRVKDITSEGFRVRVQSWDYLQGWHGTEAASYMAIERGSYELPGGIQVEAGSLNTAATNSFQYQAFADTFSRAPVVFAAVTSVNEEDAVNARLRDIKTEGFYVGMREQEKNRQIHAAERIDYIAWQDSAGEVDGLRYEVGLKPKAVTHNRYSLKATTSFAQAPTFIADLQSTNGGDSCGLRWNETSATEKAIWVQEEQSKDNEISHGKETLGYIFADVEP